MCWSYNRQYGTRYLAAMPTNLYGPGDNFDLANSHVLPALIRKTAEAKAAGAKQVVVWGTGTPRREFLYSDDLAQACCFLMNLDDARFGSLLTEDVPPLINIGTGEDVTIRELAETVARVLDFDGALVFDATKPDGTPRKLMDVRLIHSLGWQHSTALESGLGNAHGKRYAISRPNSIPCLTHPPIVATQLNLDFALTEELVRSCKTFECIPHNCLQGVETQSFLSKTVP